MGFERWLMVDGWLASLAAAPRGPALVAMAVSLAGLIVGLRFSRWFVMAAVVAGSWVGGLAIGRLMHVTPWYAALPVAFIAFNLAWPRAVASRLLSLAVAFVIACGAGTLTVTVLELDQYWTGFLVGGGLGLVLGFLARRFAAALLFGGGGVAVLGAVLGAVAQAPSGLLARQAYLVSPGVFLVGAVVLLIPSIIVQVLLDPGTDS